MDAVPSEVSGETILRRCIRQLETVPASVEATLIDSLHHDAIVICSDAPTPDLILLDRDLPKKGGREVLTGLKNDADLYRIPVVILTTPEAEQDVLRSYELHTNCYTTKPIEREKFTTIVSAIKAFWPAIVTLPKREPLVSS